MVVHACGCVAKGVRASGGPLDQVALAHSLHVHGSGCCVLRTVPAMAAFAHAAVVTLDIDSFRHLLDGVSTRVWRRMQRQSQRTRTPLDTSIKHIISPHGTPKTHAAFYEKYKLSWIDFTGLMIHTRSYDAKVRMDTHVKAPVAVIQKRASGAFVYLVSPTDCTQFINDKMVEYKLAEPNQRYIALVNNMPYVGAYKDLNLLASDGDERSNIM